MINRNEKADVPETRNPTLAPRKRVSEADRIPMANRELRLQVPEIEGYFLYWMLEKQLGDAYQAGYQHVGHDEVNLNNIDDVAGDMATSGNSDLGHYVSQVANKSDARTAHERLYLMKLRNEWHELDMKAHEGKMENVAAALRGGDIGSPDMDHQRHKYLKQGQELFIPRSKRKFK